MLFLQDAVPAQDAVDLTQSSTDFAWPGIVFIFVSFIVVAKLVAKHLVQRHELEIKFEESGKASHLKHSRGSNAWIGTAVAIVVALMFALAVLFAGVVIGGWKALEELPSLSTPATVFIFVAFLVVVNLISQHFTMKHEHAMKTGKFERVEQKAVVANKSTAKLWILGVVGIVVMFPLLGLLLLAPFVTHEITLSQPQAIGVTPIDATAPNQLSNLKRWTEDLPFDADQYPGIEACAAPLARKIANDIKADQAGDLLAEMTGKGVEAAREVSTTVFISTGNMNSGSWWYGSDFGTFKDAFKKALKSEIPSVSFHSRAGAKNYDLNFSFEEEQNFTKSYPSGTLALKSGKIVCRSNILPSKTHSVAFLQKPWLTHFKEFKSQFPHSHYYIGGAGRVESLRSRAHDRAVQNLANRLNLTAGQTEPYIVDKFTQSIERPYGKVYREAILVQNPPELVHHSLPSSRKLQFGPNGYRLSRTNTASTASPSFEFSLAMIVCLTVVAGFVSNLATQGYYRSKISQAMWVVVAVAVVFLVLTVVLQFA